MSKTSNARSIINRITGDDPELRAMIAEAAINVKVAQLIYNARIEAGLTQEELAELVGTKQQPNIARLEDADYEGHSLSMLQKIADALGQQIDITLAPKQHNLHENLSSQVNVPPRK